MYYFYHDYWRSIKNIDDFSQFTMLGGQTVWRYAQDWYFYRESDWSTCYNYRRLDNPDWADFNGSIRDDNLDYSRCMVRLTDSYINGQ